MLTERYDDAFRYAHGLHGTQTRKGTSIPYIAHLMIVSALVIEKEAAKIRRSAGFSMTRRRTRAAQTRCRRSGHDSAMRLPRSFPTVRIPGMSQSRSGNRVRKPI